MIVRLVLLVDWLMSTLVVNRSLKTLNMYLYVSIHINIVLYRYWVSHIYIYIYISHYTYIPTLIYIYIHTYKTFTHPSHHPNQGRDVLRLRNDLRHAAHPQSVPGLGRALPGDALHPSHAGGLRLGLWIRGIQFDDAWLENWSLAISGS